MPVHCSNSQFSNRRLSDGSALTSLDVAANDYADSKAKAEAKALKPPRAQMQRVLAFGARLSEAATWLGQIKDP